MKQKGLLLLLLLTPSITLSHGSPRGHTLILIQDVVTRWNLTQLILYLSKPKRPQSWGLNKARVDLPIAVSYMRDFLLTDLT